MVFNTKGNDYRLVVAINFRRQIVVIKWIGTHGDYDKIEDGEIWTSSPIRGEDYHETALRRVEELWKASQGSTENDELDILSTSIEASATIPATFVAVSYSLRYLRNLALPQMAFVRRGRKTL